MVVILGLITYYQCRRLFNIHFFLPLFPLQTEMNPLEINGNLLPPHPPPPLRPIWYGVLSKIQSADSTVKRCAVRAFARLNGEVSLHVKSKATTTYFFELMESSRDDFKQQ